MNHSAPAGRDRAVTEFITRFQRSARERRTPLRASFELTRRCNERCVHCYLGPQEDVRKLRDQEVTTEEALRIIDMLVEGGCLYLLLTGGEAMLRRDFVEIFTHAKRSGLLVTVFTNGTLLRNDVLEAFKTYPPQSVEISLYGGTKETYEAVTRTQGHGTFERALRNIQRLIDNDIEVALKTVLMTLNKHELEDMKQIADRFGLKFKFDPAIFPFLDGDKTPLQYRVPLEELMAIESRDEQRMQSYADHQTKHPNAWVGADTQYTCGAGLRSLHIDPYGYIQPCLLTPHYRFNVLERGLASIWNGEIKAARDKKAAADFACNSCQHRPVCAGCSAFFKLETDSESERSNYVCEMTHRRAKVVEQFARERASIAPIVINPRPIPAT